MPVLISLFVLFLIVIMYFYLKGLSNRILNPLRYENNPDLYKYYNTPEIWKQVLHENVPFYKRLSNEKKVEFELKVQKFFMDYTIKGYNTNIELKDRLLVAAGGVIPAFEFKNWMYDDLERIYLISDSFNEKFETGKKDSNKDGIVYKNNMYLSKKALYNDFIDEKSKCNVAIHEFAHFIDFADKQEDGFPGKLLEEKFKIQWYEFSIRAAKESKKGLNNINHYAYKNLKEFFAVMCEYFFEQPKELEEKHPEAFQLLKKAFSSKMGSVFTVKHISKLQPITGCPCRSGKKYRNCCLK